MQGLLGPDDGNPSTDLQLPNGQSIASNGTITSSNLYGAYATAWQVPNTASSLLYYTGEPDPLELPHPRLPRGCADAEPVAGESCIGGRGDRRGGRHHQSEPHRCGGDRPAGYRRSEFGVLHRERAGRRRPAEQRRGQHSDAAAERWHHGRQPPRRWSRPAARWRSITRSISPRLRPRPARSTTASPGRVRTISARPTSSAAPARAWCRSRRARPARRSSWMCWPTHSARCRMRNCRLA